jgi:hypothetical protein
MVGSGSGIKHPGYATLTVKLFGNIFSRYYSINVPLREGMDDLSYELVFCPVIEHVINYFRLVSMCRYGRAWMTSAVRACLLSGYFRFHFRFVRNSLRYFHEFQFDLYSSIVNFIQPHCISGRHCK